MPFCTYILVRADFFDYLREISWMSSSVSYFTGFLQSTRSNKPKPFPTSSWVNCFLWKPKAYLEALQLKEFTKTQISAESLSPDLPKDNFMFVGPGHCGLRSNKCTTNTLSVSRLANKKLGQNLITFLHDPSRNANHALFAGLGEGVLKLIDFGFSKYFKEGKMMKSYKGKGCWELLEDASRCCSFSLGD